MSTFSIVHFALHDMHVADFCCTDMTIQLELHEGQLCKGDLPFCKPEPGGKRSPLESPQTGKGLGDYTRKG